MIKMRLFLAFLLLFLFLNICSCVCLKESLNNDSLFVRIRNDKERKILEQFIIGKKEYNIKGDVVICSDLMSKIVLKRHIVLNDLTSFGTISSNYYIDFYYNSDGTYLPNGIHRILITYSWLELKDLVISDYINDDDFKDVNKTFKGMRILVPNYDLYDKLKLKDILPYFQDGSLSGWGQGINDYMVCYESDIFKELNVDFTTLVIYLIDQGFYVKQDDESGALLIIMN